MTFQKKSLNLKTDIYYKLKKGDVYSYARN